MKAFSVMGMWPGLVIMLLAGWVTGPLRRMVRVGLTVGIGIICADTLTKVCLIVVVLVVPIASGAVESKSYDVWTFDKFKTGVRVVVVIELWTDALTRTLNGAVVPDIDILFDLGATMWASVIAALELMTLPTLLNLLLLF